MGTFEFNGEKYRQASRHQKEWGSRLMAGLKLNGREAILDLGCGDGVLTDQLALLVPDGRVVGLDASEGMIQTAMQYKKDNLDFIHMDINEMDYTNEFDVIYSNAALHWVKDHVRLIRNVYKALKPGGIIQWNFAGNGTTEHFIHTVRALMKEDMYKEYFQDFDWPWFMPDRAGYDTLISDGGFSSVYVEEENADRYFSDTDELARWIDQPCIVPFLQCIPAQKKDRFRHDVIQAMIRRTKQPDGTCFETFRRIKVQVVK